MNERKPGSMSSKGSLLWGEKKPFQHRKYNRCRAAAITECYTENKFITAAINGAEHLYRENKERRLQ